MNCKVWNGHKRPGRVRKDGTGHDVYDKGVYCRQRKVQTATEGLKYLVGIIRKTFFKLAFLRLGYVIVDCTSHTTVEATRTPMTKSLRRKTAPSSSFALVSCFFGAALTSEFTSVVEQPLPEWSSTKLSSMVRCFLSFFSSMKLVDYVPLHGVLWETVREKVCVAQIKKRPR
jgi:hypothetical protein